MILSYEYAKTDSFKQKERNMLKGISPPIGDIQRIDAEISEIKKDIQDIKRRLSTLEEKVDEILNLLKQKGVTY